MTLEDYIKSAGKPGPFKPGMIVQDVDGETFVTVMFKDEQYYGAPLTPNITVYKSMDTHRIVGCAMFLEPPINTPISQAEGKGV